MASTAVGPVGVSKPAAVGPAPVPAEEPIGIGLVEEPTVEGPVESTRVAAPVAAVPVVAVPVEPIAVEVVVPAVAAMAVEQVVPKIAVELEVLHVELVGYHPACKLAYLVD